ncbi:MAG TPA: ricin-type beta-trefoil lectin domain protein [Streptosporangiaceae bacterium]
MHSRSVAATFVSIAALVIAGLSASAVSVPAVASAHAAASSRSLTADPLPVPVSQTPVSYTPNVYEGSNCGQACKSPSDIYATAVVNGEVVVAGAFSAVCTPASASPTYAECPTTANVTDIFAFDPATGAIDPNFEPVLDTGPVNALAAGPNDSVIIGGAFTSVNGTGAEGLAELYVTPGQSTDGQLVPGFAGQTNGTVTSLASDGTAVYVAGLFTQVDGTFRRIARLNAATGAADTKFKITIADSFNGINLHVKTIALSPDGSTLAMAGTFQTVNGNPVPRLALISTGGGLGKTATVNDWAAPLLENTCSNQHDYINGLDFSPDGSFIVIGDTGYMSNGQPGICDAAARFNVDVTGNDVQPAWINYTGGDSLYSVAITGGTVYIGGHQRWANNECGNNQVCENDAVLVDGLAAVDANTGVALAWWRPQTGRGVGVASLTAFPVGTFPGSNGGLLIGTNVNNIGGTSHYELGMLPGVKVKTAVEAGGPIQAGMFSDGRLGGVDESGQGTAAMCVDDAGNSTNQGNPVELITCSSDNEQNWTVGSDSTLSINGLCLDTQGEGTAPGTPVEIDPCDGSTTQQWQQGTGNTVVNQGSGLCLTDPGASTDNGTHLEIDTCTGGQSQDWPLPAAQAPPAPPATGLIYSQNEQRSSQPPCAAISKNSTSPGAAIVMEACKGQKDQQWTLEANGSIQNQKGLCLTTTNEQSYSGVGIVQATCDGSPIQQWTPGQSRSLVNGYSHMCLDDPGSDTANGTQLIMYYCNNGSNQSWWLPTY